jgi:hypothetical protein
VLREDAAMDVVVAPAEVAPDRWNLNDRLGRAVGEIYRASFTRGFMLHLLAHGDSPDADLGPYPSLDIAMNAVESQLKGSCQLSEPG